MRSTGFVVLFAAVFVMVTPGWAATLYPAGAEVRQAQLLARLSTQDRAWIRQEASREEALNGGSESDTRQAVQTGGLDLTNIPIQDAVLNIMMIITNDAHNDMRPMVA